LGNLVGPFGRLLISPHSPGTVALILNTNAGTQVPDDFVDSAVYFLFKL
jgi:hypothetical protein